MFARAFGIFCCCFCFPTAAAADAAAAAAAATALRTAGWSCSVFIFYSTALRTAGWSCSVFIFYSNSFAKAIWWWMLYRTLRKVTGTNMRKSMYVVTPRCAAAAAAAVVSAVVLRRPPKEYTHPYSMMHADCLLQVLRSRLITTNY